MNRVLLCAIVLCASCTKSERPVETPPPPAGEVPATPRDTPEAPSPPMNEPIDPSSEPNQLPPEPKPTTGPNTMNPDLRSPLLATTDSSSPSGPLQHGGSAGTSGRGGTSGSGGIGGTTGGSGGKPGGAGTAGTAIR
jgi:hypothetical protein